jgi:hypothetical protein
MPAGSVRYLKQPAVHNITQNSLALLSLLVGLDPKSVANRSPALQRLHAFCDAYLMQM